MPATKRPKPLYQRGDYKLYRRDGRGLEIVWYDTERKRERSRSAGDVDVADGRLALDRFYLEETKGEAFCPTCGHARTAEGVLVTSAIADYLVLAEDKASIGAIRPRLAHIVTYLAASGQLALRCAQVDAAWVERFRKWAKAQPIQLPGGKTRIRAPSTIENSVLQLAAAINRSGGTRALFKAEQPKEVNQTPTFRADVATLARMFRYCLYPEAESEKWRKRRIHERRRVLAFLRISVATWARPDAAHDVSLAPALRQWDSEHRVLNLNQAGRRQTRKFRATVPIARQFAPHLDDAGGLLIPTASVENAWVSMEIVLGLPRDGQSGMKLIRRSMANLARQRLPEEAWGEVSIMLGHTRFDETSDLYAPFSPTYLRRVLAVNEAIIDELETACPGAFYRTFTASGGKVVALGVAKNG